MVKSGAATLFRDEPQALRRLILLLYALVGPLFTVVLYLEANPALRARATIAVAALVIVPAAVLLLRSRPTSRDWILPVAVAPTLCCGIAYAACGEHVPAYLGVLGAPLAWAAVLLEAPIVWMAFGVALATCFVAIAAARGPANALASTLVFGVIFGLVAWVVHLKARALRAAREQLRAQAARDRALLSALPDTLAIADREGRFKDVHAPPDDPLPLPAEQLVGRPVYEFLPVAAQEPIRAAIARTLATGEVERVVYTAQYPSGTRTFESRIARSLPGEIVVLRQNITARLQAEAEQRLKNELVEAMQEAVVTVGLDFRVVTWSPGAEQVFGWRSHEAVGRPIYSLVRPDVGPEEYEAMLRRVLAEGRYSETNGRTRKDGRRVAVETTFVALRDAAQEPVGILGVSRDVTALQATLAENAELVQGLREALNSVKTLSGLLPICMYCKKIRDDQGYWERIEEYLSTHTDAAFTHGMCPDCYEKHRDDG
jgi:PAS domain S-box-containing protein